MAKNQSKRTMIEIIMCSPSLSGAMGECLFFWLAVSMAGRKKSLWKETEKSSLLLWYFFDDAATAQVHPLVSSIPNQATSSLLMENGGSHLSIRPFQTQMAISTIWSTQASFKQSSFTSSKSSNISVVQSEMMSQDRLLSQLPKIRKKVKSS